ncbi:MAG: LarC family nickel insertion protein [Actinobacteria bacterium]|nr:LarC family nickel insertion protein [Actinomycetota bacterium]
MDPREQSKIYNGASDAWSRPVLMKKGRPGQEITCISDPWHGDTLRAVLFRETTTLGVRGYLVEKWQLQREWVTVDVAGSAVRLKVGRLGGEVTLFHCLEWFHDEKGMRLLIAHEDTHAWHEISLGAAPPEDDAAWLAFYEGTAITATRAVVPGRPEEEYFWYGHGGFAEWLPWCEEHRGDLLARFAADLDDPAAVETWFGAGLVDNRWRVGYYVADQLVRQLDRPLPELVRMSVEQARAAIRDALED